MTTVWITHPAFAAHDTGPGHPECPARMRAIDRALERPEFTFLVREEAPLRADVEDQIVLAHTPAHLAALKSIAPGPGGHAYIDPDTPMSQGSLPAALLAVGAGLHAVDLVLDDATRVHNAFVQARPPGHHAEADQAMGFCLFNTVAIAALYARARHGAERVAVVDFDVHHGNGTQHMFEADGSLFYASTHEMPLFPGTGDVSECGVGNICNAPLRAGDGGARFREAVQSRILPALHAFGPDLILISAGFDAHADDPLANLRLAEADFAWVTERICSMARQHCGGRVVSVLEGGYNLNALARSVAAHVGALMAA